MTIALQAMAWYWRGLALPVLLWALLSGTLLLGAAGVQAADCGNDRKCLVVVGGAFTRHGPVDALDSHGDWGVAASRADKDFANQLLMLLQASQGGRWVLRRESGFDLEANPGAPRVPSELARAARGAAVVVLQIGDNLDTRRVPLPAFTKGYAEAARALKPAQGSLACVGSRQDPSGGLPRRFTHSGAR